MLEYLLDLQNIFSELYSACSCMTPFFLKYRTLLLSALSGFSMEAVETFLIASFSECFLY